MVHKPTVFFDANFVKMRDFLLMPTLCALFFSFSIYFFLPTSSMWAEFSVFNIPCFVNDKEKLKCNCTDFWSIDSYKSTWVTKKQTERDRFIESAYISTALSYSKPTHCHSGLWLVGKRNQKECVYKIWRNENDELIWCVISNNTPIFNFWCVLRVLLQT